MHIKWIGFFFSFLLVWYKEMLGSYRGTNQIETSAKLILSNDFSRVFLRTPTSCLWESTMLMYTLGWQTVLLFVFLWASVSSEPHCARWSVADKTLLTHRRPSWFCIEINSFKWSLNERRRQPCGQILTAAVDVTCRSSCRWRGSGPPLYCVVIRWYVTVCRLNQWWRI